MTRDEQITQLTEELMKDSLELPARERVCLLKALMLDRRQEEKNQLEMMRIQATTKLLESDNSPFVLNQGIGRRLLTDGNKDKQATG